MVCSLLCCVSIRLERIFLEELVSLDRVVRPSHELAERYHGAEVICIVVVRLAQFSTRVRIARVTVLVCKLRKVRHRDEIRESFDSSSRHAKLEIKRSLMEQAFP
jgi:hypothetical protein